MAKVYSIHSLALKAGVKGEDFERYFYEMLKAAPTPAGVTVRLLKGDRGDRKGKYAMMAEFDSVERRNKLFPQEGPGATAFSDEVAQWMIALAPVTAEWEKYATPFDVIYTDYTEV
jgi:hypothetical protein